MPSEDGKSVKVVQIAHVDHLTKGLNIESTSLCHASASVKLGPREVDDPAIEEPYCQAVGSLNWLANMSRPNFANVVRNAVHHMSGPNAEQ